MKRIFILLSFAFIGLSLTAQDIHFSQYYASPLTLNPALTGKFDGLYRVSAIYRDQWRTIQEKSANTFMTPSVSVDFSLLKDKLKNSALGVGAVVTYDKVGSFTTYDIGANIAYHLGLDKNGKYHLALGFQGMYSNRKIASDFTFEEELLINPTFIDDGNVDTKAHNLFSLTPGLMFDAKVGKNATIYAGYSLFMNLTPGEDIFLTGGTPETGLPMRHMVNAGAEFGIKKFLIIPGVLFQMQDNVNEFNFGITAGYKLIEKEKKNTKLFLGLWSRMHATGADDPTSLALIPKIGFDFENFRFSGAFDIGLGQIAKDSQQASNVGKLPTAFEIAINYFGQGSTPVPTNTYLFNPRF